jgi:hypothetical protein
MMTGTVPPSTDHAAPATYDPASTTYPPSGIGAPEGRPLRM